MGLHCTSQRCLVVASAGTSVEVMSKLVVLPSSLIDTCFWAQAWEQAGRAGEQPVCQCALLPSGSAFTGLLQPGRQQEATLRTCASVLVGAVHSAPLAPVPLHW